MLKGVQKSERERWREINGVTEMYPVVKFNWMPEMEIFVVCQYAEFQKPAKIALNIMDFYSDECTKGVKQLGFEAFQKILLRRIYELSPKKKKFPKKYQEVFDNHRRAYLIDLDSSYLAHPRNRLRELDRLYEITSPRVETENINDACKATKMCLDIMNQAHEETVNFK